MINLVPVYPHQALFHRKMSLKSRNNLQFNYRAPFISKEISGTFNAGLKSKYPMVINFNNLPSASLISNER